MEFKNHDFEDYEPRDYEQTPRLAESYPTRWLKFQTDFGNRSYEQFLVKMFVCLSMLGSRTAVWGFKMMTLKATEGGIFEATVPRKGRPLTLVNREPFKGSLFTYNINILGLIS